jgi:phosphohistidine phosphatase
MLAGDKPGPVRQGEEALKTLLIMRHAKSSWKEEGQHDHERPLNKRGKRDAPRMGEWLRAESLEPDLIVCSSAVRARKTAEAVAEASRFGGEIEISANLYAAEPEAYFGVLSALPDKPQRVLVIGHNPGLEQLVNDLTGEAVSMSTAAIAQVTLPIKHWSELDETIEGQLVAVRSPREVE